MRQTIALVTVVVRDYDEAIAYYTRTLGFRLLEDTLLGNEAVGARRASRLERRPLASGPSSYARPNGTRWRSDRVSGLPVLGAGGLLSRLRADVRARRSVRRGTPS